MTIDELMKRPLPAIDEPDTAPFWEAAKAHRLTYQRCDRCDEVVFHPRAHCTACLGASLTWHDASGTGTVYTFTIVRENRHPAFVDSVPYVVAWINLDEGFRMMSNIVDVEVDEVAIGQRVEVAWEQVADDIVLPVFRPA